MYRKELTENYLVLEDKEVIKTYKSQECAENYVNHLIKWHPTREYAILKVKNYDLKILNKRK